MRFAFLYFALSCLALVSAWAGPNPPHPTDRLLLRAPDSTVNQRGDHAVLQGVATSFRLDSAGEFSATVGIEDLKPLVQWYHDRGQEYYAYTTFIPGVDSSIGYLDEISPAGRTLDLDGNLANPIPFLPETFDQIVQISKDYVDAGVDGIEYDVAWVTFDAGPFDAVTLADFRSWLNARYTESELQTIIDPGYDEDLFDYGQFLRDGGITADGYQSQSIGGTPLFETKHWRLWSAFLRFEEREMVSSLVSQVNAYALAETGSEIKFFFNRHGYFSRSADRWFLSEYASGDVGEVWFPDLEWNYPLGFTMEPLFRATLNAYGNRFEPWNSPTQETEAVQSVYLAETIANNGVATWYDAFDHFAGPASVARFANRFEQQLNHPPVPDVAIFYPLATALHTRPHQIGTQPFIGGSHYWYLGLGYLMQDLELNYDVVFAGDGLGMPDAFTDSDLSGYSVVLVSEAIQTTDSQFTEILDYVHGGGTLLVMGTDCFRYDPLGDDRSSHRSYDGNSWSDLFGAVGDTAIGSGVVKMLSLSPWGSHGFTGQPISAELNTAKAGVGGALPSGLPAVTTSSAGIIRALRYRDVSDNSEVYHIINYTFDFLGTIVTSQSGFTIDFPSPPLYAGTPVAQYVQSPEEDPVALTITDLGGGMSRVTIPQLDYWGILRVGSAIANDAHPEIPPIAYFNRLPDNGIHSVASPRSLVYTAVDDSGLDELAIHYQLQDPDTKLYSGWTKGDAIMNPGSNDLRDQNLDFTPPQEGLYRLQLVATDDNGNESGLFVGGYDTLVGYDTTPPDRSGLGLEANHGVSSGSVIVSPITPSFTFEGAEDTVSGIQQYNYRWTKGGQIISEGNDVQSVSNNLDFPEIGPVDYGKYELWLRFQNGAGVWDDDAVAYVLIFTLPPTYNGGGSSETASAGSNIDFSLDFTSVYGDLSIQWYKDDVPIGGATGSTLELVDLAAEDAGTYHATIANPAGQIESADFLLNVTTPLAITSQPSAVVVDEGDPFTLSVEAVGTGLLRYQWKRNGSPIDAATSSTYHIGAAAPADHQGDYVVTVTDDLESADSDPAMVSVTPLQEQTISIVVIASSKSPFQVDIQLLATVEDLEGQIAIATGYDSNELRIYLGSSELESPSQTLADAGLADGDQITALLETDQSGASYASWQLTQFGGARSGRLPGEDANQDDLPNLFHYAIGGQTFAGLDIDYDPIEGRIYGTYPKNSDGTEVTLSLELSMGDLSSWGDAQSHGVSIEERDGLVHWSFIILHGAQVHLRLAANPNW